MQHDVVTELFYDGEWHTVPVYARGGVELSRGAGGEDDEAPPSTVGLTFDNRTGDYSPRNALSPLFGVAGRNTPLRVSTATAQTSVSDTFTRSVTDDWGTATSGETYTVTGVGGALFSHFQVTGTVGTMAVSENSAYRLAYLPDVSYVDCEAYAECTVAAATGGTLEPTLVLRLQDNVTYYMVRAELFPDFGEIVLSIRKIVDNVDTELAFVANVASHTAANPIKIRGRVVGSTIQAKAWQGSTEPDWQATASDFDITGAGGVGLRSGVGADNTNTKSVTFTWDNYAVTPVNVRSMVEVSSWAPGRNANNSDAWTAIQGAGILRRLGQGSTPIRSTAWQAYMSPENDADRVDYWPLEEESGATAILSPAGSAPIRFEDVQLGGDTTSAPSSARMLTLGSAGALRADVRPYTGSAHSTHLLWTLPDAGLLDQEVMTRIHFSGGTIGFADVAYGLPNGLILQLYGHDTSVIGTSGPWGPFNIDGNHFLMRVIFNQFGSDVDTEMHVGMVDDSPWLYAPFTFVGQTVGRISLVHIHAVGASVGHFAIGNTADAFSNFTQTEGGIVGLKGFADETAGARFLRLSEEAGLRAYVHGDPADTQLMGPQPVATLADLLAECVRTDDGMMYEPRNDRAVVMRTGRSRYNQAAALELDFEGAQITPTIAPALDDRHTRNDITANRINGSEARAVRDSGPLNVTDPLDDPEGVGRYDTTISVNPAADDALPRHAHWHLHRGTVDEPRYPEVTVDLDAAPELRAAVDNVEIGDRITIANMPTDWQQDPGDLIVLGIRESYPPGTGGRRRTVTFVCIPASQFEIGIVGAEDGSIDLRGQAVDTDKSTLAAAIDDDDTALTVSSTDGVVWTTDPDDWDTGLHGTGTYGAGLFLRAGGEVMRVTNITNAASDNFGRTVANGWGTADSGGTWTVAFTASQYAVSSGTGRITPDTLNSNRFATLAAPGADHTVQADIMYAALPASGTLIVGLCPRLVDTSNYYLAEMRISTAGVVTLRLSERIVGTPATLVDYTHPTAYVGGAWWRIRAQAEGTLLRAKAWVASGTEPDWQISTTDSSLTSGANVSCYARNDTAVTTHTAQFDAFTIANPQTITVVRSVNGVVKAHSAGAAVHVAHPVRVGL